MRHLERGAIVGLTLVIALTAACSEKTTPAGPTPINVTGTWVGDVTVQATPTRMTWTLTQTDTAVTGPVLLRVANGTVLLNGFLTGSLSGSSLTYVITVTPGGIPTQPTCAGQIGGVMTVTIAATSTLSGTSAVTSSSCSAPFPGGTLTLTRQ